MDGTVISAAFQHHGKGQFGRKWLSNPGENLSFSIILYPEFLAVHKQFYLSMVVALSICEAVDQLTGLNTTIKWPNDIYYQKQKLGGILIVNQMMGIKWTGSVVGIGLNVNQIAFDPELPNPCSLRIATQKLFSLEEVLSAVLMQLEHNYNQLLRSAAWEDIHNKYHQKLLGWQQEVEYQTEDNEEMCSGRLMGVDDTGRILLEKNGITTRFANGEIRLRY